MKFDIKHAIVKLFCYFLSLVVAASVVTIITMSVGTGMLRTEKYVQGRFDKYNAQLLEEVNTSVENLVQDTGLPTRAFTESIQTGHMNTVLHQVSGNIVYGYKTDFSESKYLYGYYRTGIINFCKENGIAITEDEIVRNACYAVDAFNQACGDESTASIMPFEQTYTKNPLYAIIISVVAIIACFIMLNLLILGRHKKFDYIAAGISAGGATLFALPLLSLIMDYSSTLHFTDVDVYNMGIADTIDGVFKVLMAIGVILFIGGTAILVMNFQYYKHKGIQIKTEREINQKLRREYLENHQAALEAREKATLENKEDEEPAGPSIFN